MKQLIQDVEELRDEIATYCKPMDVFSDDKGKSALAKLKSELGKILFKLKASVVKECKYSNEKCFRQNTSKNQLVKIRPCGEEFGNKTYLGFYIGDIALALGMQINDGTIEAFPAIHNPAIYVPELGKVIFGAESWWGTIESEDELKEITNEDINNVWYVQMLKKMKEDGVDSNDM